MRLRELFKAAEYDLPTELKYLQNAPVMGITCDSRRVEPGYIFVAMEGMSVNGQDYAQEAAHRGALLIVAASSCENLPTATMVSPRKALADLCDAYWGHPSKTLKLIGITGTNGKTSTAAILYAILREAGYSTGLIGTVECLLNGQKIQMQNADPLANMTTPDPTELYAILAAMRDGGATYVIMEVTSHALAFEKTAPLWFHRALFTNLTPDHLDFHGDMETYFFAKRRLFECAELAVINAHAMWGRRMAQSIRIPVLSVDADSVTHVVSNGINGSNFHLNIHEGSLPLHIGIPGDFFVENAALAARTALSMGISPAAVDTAISCFPGVRGRMEKVSGGHDDISVFLDYAHTPDALEKLLQTARRFRPAGSRIILLFGCGGDRDTAKRPLMGKIASQLADMTVLTSDNCRSEDPMAIIEDILGGFDPTAPHEIVLERMAAIHRAVEIAAPGDILLLAGKGHENYEIRGDKRLPFCERDIVKAALAERRNNPPKEDKNHAH